MRFDPESGGSSALLSSRSQKYTARIGAANNFSCK
jgi:hypothetical protein